MGGRQASLDASAVADDADSDGNRDLESAVGLDYGQLIKAKRCLGEVQERFPVMKCKIL